MRKGLILLAILGFPFVSTAQTISSTTVTDNGNLQVIAGDFDGDGGGDLVSVDTSGNVNCIPSHGGLYDMSPIISSVQNPPVFSYSSAKLNPNASDYIILGSQGIVNVYSSSNCLFTLTQTVIIQGVPTSILVIPNLLGDAGIDVAVISGSQDFARVYRNNAGTLSPGPAGLGTGYAGLAIGSSVAIENPVVPQPPGPLPPGSISLWSYANNAWTNTPSVIPTAVAMGFAIAPKTNTAFLVSHDLTNIYIQQLGAGGTLASPVSFPVGSEPLGIAIFDGDSLAIVLDNPSIQILQDLNGNGNWQLGTLISVPLSRGEPAWTWTGLTATLAGGFAAQTESGTATVYKILSGSMVSTSNSLTFPSTALGGTSTLPLTVMNTGNQSLTLSQFSISGTNGADFSQTNNCTSVAPLNSCTVTVAYTPSSFYSESATLTISSNALNSPTSVALTSVPGPYPIVSVSSTSLDYGNVPVNSTVAKMLTIGNSGTFVLSNLSVGVSGAGFALSNSCPSTLAILASCSVTVNFMPVAPGNATGTLTIMSDVNPVTVGLQGTGVAVPPIVSSLSPASVTAGGSGFTLTVNGISFAPGATVNFNGSPRTMTFTSATQLTTLIAAEDIASAGWNQVTVANPGAGASNAVAFTVNSGSVAPVTGVALRYVAVAPCRLADTRTTPIGPFAGPSITGGTSRSFTIPQSSTCNIPPAAAAYSLNVAVIPSSPLGFLTLWPTGQAQPVAAIVSSVDGRVRSNAAIVPAGANGAISVYASNTTDVVLDINGYFTTDPSALQFYPVTPCRVVDTRPTNGPNGPLAGPSLTGNTSRTFPLPTSPCNLPATAQAYSLNLTAVPQEPLGYLTAWPAGQTQPGTANLSSTTGTVTSNAAIMPAGTNGSIDVYASNNTDLIIDVNGYFAPAGTGGLSLYTLPPCRVLDTRQLSDAQTAQAFSGELDANIQASACGVPTGAQAYVLNATVVPSAPLGYLTLWPQGTAQPLAATVSAIDQTATSNLAIVPTTNELISLFAANPTQLVLDIFGYFAP
ncbi:MAG: choice-of-anchor D domain-containing protein [Candidatus Acidiferrales bacterium]|jgi:hypothetical protein